MIFDTLAAYADWLNDRKFDDDATPQEVKEIIDDLERSTGPRNATDPITQGGTMKFNGEKGKHEARVFASAMQTRTPRSAIEAAMGSSSSSSSSLSSSSLSSSSAVQGLFGHPAIAAFDDYLEHVYHLEEDAGSNRQDAHGALTLVEQSYTSKDVARAAGINGFGADFEEADSTYLDSQATMQQITGNVSRALSLWVKPESVATTQAVGGWGGGSAFALAVVSGEVRYLADWMGTMYGTGYSLAAGTWYHLILTHDGATTKFYGNAADEETPSFSPRWNRSQTLNTDSSPLFVGVDPGWSYFFDGIVDEACIWKDTALNAAAIEALYNSGAGRFYAA